MKKIIKIFMLLLITLLSACSNGLNNNVDSDSMKKDISISELYDNTFEKRMDSSFDNTYHAIFFKEDKYYLLTANLTDDQFNTIENSTTSDYDAQELEKKNIILTVEDYSIEDITSRIPSEDELNQYIGLTIGEMESKNFYMSGYSSNDEDVFFFLDGPVYEIEVHPSEDSKIKNIDDYSLNDMKEIKIGSVEFLSFSFNIFE